MKPSLIALGLSAVVLLSSCTVGPNYRRPAVPDPVSFRGAEQAAEAGQDQTSLADLSWPEIYDDEVLRELISEALEQNYDLRIATARVLETHAQYGVSRADLLPTLDARGQFVSNRGSSIGSFVFIPRGTRLDVSYTQAGFGLNWELDLWGRIRRLNESARAQFLASEEARHGVMTTLVADVASTYYALIELDLEREIAERTRATAEDSLELVTLRRDQGVATGLEVRQAEQFLYTSTAQIANIQRLQSQAENAMSLLLGRSPGDIRRGRGLADWDLPAGVPAGLPSALLDRRPDIRFAEEQLVAANALIGAAKAQYFPQITLTGFLGGQSRALTDLFTGPGRNWNLAPAATLPIFNAGRIRNQVRVTEAQQTEALLNYQKSIQTAFREVADALVEFRQTAEEREQQTLLVDALSATVDLSTVRYEGGIDSYLQVLDAQRNLFQQQLALARLRQRELTAIVELYRALGGGWEM